MNVNLLKDALNDKVKELGYDLISLTSKKEKGDLILSIVVDRIEPIDMNAICEISQKLSEYLDTLDTGDESYMLDVSSLGAEKPIAIDKLKDYVGRYVQLHLINPYNGENIMQGSIVYCDDEKLVLNYKIKTREFNAELTLKNIAKARLAIKF